MPSSMPRLFRRRNSKSTSTRQVIHKSRIWLPCVLLLWMLISLLHWGRSDADRGEHPSPRVDCLGRVGCLSRTRCAGSASDELSDGGCVASFAFCVEVDFSCSLARARCTWTVFFEEAKEVARSLDAEFAETGILKGPLHGVPISVKDQCAFYSSFLLLSARRSPQKQLT